MNSESNIPLWRPDDEYIAQSNMMSFIKFINSKYNLHLSSYEALYQWSVQEIEEFWLSLLEFSKIKYAGEIQSVLESKIGTIFGAKWFNGVKLNFAENLLSKRDNSTAIVHYDEQMFKIKNHHNTNISEINPRRISFDELYKQVAKLASSLRNAGVVPGDRVAAYISNIPEAIIAMLATTSIGAIWSSTSPDFGYQGVYDRFSQIKPKVLFAVDGYYYNGKRFSLINTILKLSDNIPSLERIIIIDKIGEMMPQYAGYYSFDKFTNNQASEIIFEQMPFDQPSFILYSSGTTGAPKCIVHGVGGTLIQHFKELKLHTDLNDGDAITYYTTCGWMMWNWLAGSLMIGATVVLYDGSPSYPDLSVLWKIVEKEKIKVFGTSPKFLSSNQKIGLVPKIEYDLSKLKIILSTGSPLLRENFQWVYNQVKNDIQLSSISGGTDIVSCFMLGNPLLPVYEEEIQCIGLGMRVEAWNESGKPIIGEKGELVCTAPAPSMPVSFWNDNNDEQYLKAYFKYFDGIWRHGDFIKITERNSVIVYGRSDATLNRGGIRFGTADIYRVLESFDEIIDSLIVSQNWADDMRIILFIVPRFGIKLDEDLIDKVRHEIRTQLSPRHIPDLLIPIAEVPVTMNGKKVELAVTKILNGEQVTNLSSLGNPHSLDQFYRIRDELKAIS